MRWKSTSMRALLWQTLVFGAFAAAFLLIFRNVSNNLGDRGVTTGFEFLSRTARIPLAGSPFEIEGPPSYGLALLVGALNTLKVTTISILISTLIGLVVGVGRLSKNILMRKLTKGYVETFRNIPVLIHILFWYILLSNLPGPQNALSPIAGVYLSNRGLVLPTFDLHSLAWDVPHIDGFGFAGGFEVTPECAALVIGLTLYTAAFLAEIVRSSIQSVHRGQVEAVQALGLSPYTTLRRVVLPQAVRVAIPSATNEYLGILKNSSLAIAIGYQELTSIANTALYENGQALEVIAICMVFYLSVSLLVSGLMNIYNARVALVER